MKKKFTIIVCVSLVVFSIVLLSLFCIVPNYYESRYETNKSSENLYELCKYVYTFNNNEMVLKYYPVLLFETNYDNYSWEYEKDNMVTRLIEKSINYSDFDTLKDLLSKACITYSTEEFAEICVIDFIYGYYEQYNKLEETYSLFETAINSFNSVEYKFSLCTEYAQFVNLYTDNTEKFEEVNNRKKDLAEQVKIHWEEETNQGDGSMIDN